MVVESGTARERVVIRMNAPDTAETAAVFLARYPELCESVTTERLLGLYVESVGPEAFERTDSSGKLRTVID